MQVREGREIMHGDYGTAQVIGKNEVDATWCWRADQVLVGINRTRRRYNSACASSRALTQPPIRRPATSWCACGTIPAKGLLNGSLWQVMTSSKETVKPGINLLSAPRTTTWTAASPRSSCSRRLR
jgi:exodeoxyribonuclease-5